jgi:hypothetical protein
MLIMDSPGRLVLARRDRNRAGSGGKRPPDPEAQNAEPEAAGVPAAVGRAEGLNAKKKIRKRPAVASDAPPLTSAR